MDPILRSAKQIGAQFGLAAFLSLCLAGAAHAGGRVTLPDPNALTLLALGVAGLLIGRRAARRRDGD